MTETFTTARTKRLLQSLPDGPGIYVFRDSSGKVLYVGKAKSLRKRVTSYFRKNGNGDAGARIARMLKRLHDFDFVVTSSETEALLLESNFIKHHRPPFNIMLRDDKSYPYVAITLNEEYPRVIFTRQSHRPGIVYFGPFSSAGKVRETLDLLGKVFPYRKCRGPNPGRRSGTPCLNYHIGLCLAPCIGNIDPASYREIISKVERLLSGKSEGLAAEIGEEMEKAAAGQRYEEAAVFRNRLKALEHLLEKQQASAIGISSLDVIGIFAEGDSANVQVLQVRDDALSDRRSFFLKNIAGESGDKILEQFVISYYSTPIAIPAEVVMPPGFGRSDALKDFLSEKRGSCVEVKPAARGKRRKLLEMAAQNAALALRQDKLREEERKARPARALAGLKDALRLKKKPMRIECFDISNIGGRHPVGSMAVFEGGVPNPAHYRKFSIRKSSTPDDFAMMAEVIFRRFSKNEGDIKGVDFSFSSRPDLVVVDGGAGQVSAAAGSLEALNLKIPVAGIAKRHEDIYLPGEPGPLSLPVDSAALGLLKRIRDEAHRFAIIYHRQRRDSEVSSSMLDGIPGVGPARKKAILAHFGSPDRFLSARRDELEAVPGLPSRVAREVYAYVHKLDCSA